MNIHNDGPLCVAYFMIGLFTSFTQTDGERALAVGILWPLAWVVAIIRSSISFVRNDQ